MPANPQASQLADQAHGLGDRLVEAGHGTQGSPVRHVRKVLRWAGSWYFQCACGYVSGGLLTEVEAETRACEIHVLEVESAERKRRLYGMAR